VAARPLRVEPAVAALDAPRPLRRRLVGRATAVVGDPRRGDGGRAPDPVQHQRDRGPCASGSGHQPGAARCRGAERDLRRAGRDPRLPCAQPDVPRRAYERERTDGGPDRGDGAPCRGRLRRLGDRADPADDRWRRAGVPRPGLPGRVGLGQAQGPAPGRVRGGAPHPGHDHRNRQVPARRGGRPGDGGHSVRGQLRADRAGARGRVRGDLPLQRGPPGGRACGAPHDGATW
jgi:hypothetical protein